ncbi:MAG: carboxypeptidase regulatory-like domain-containing protein [Pyrinomonadaceae bacterium]|nr:carboxypeptidase regulatory-like domain-containing protein [Pyrinomonadaceae bacterium]
MKFRAIAVLLSLTMSVLLVPARGVQQDTDEPRFHVRIETSKGAALRENLEAAGYDVLGVDTQRSKIDLAVTRAEWRALKSRGYTVELVDRARPLREVLLRQTQAQPFPAPGLAAVPATYSDLDGLVHRMQEIADAYPAIALLVDITATYGTPPTVEGRHLFALKISDNVTVDEDEPSMLVVSAHHAREISTPVITLGAAERLTSGYEIDPQITAAVNGHEIWLAPVWNPDGYSYVFTNNNLWRKNRRVFTSGTGVDQNRNYTQGWSASCAGSTNPSSDTYKGPSAASEAETQTMMTWSDRERFAKVIDYHSFGQEVLYAYLCLSHPFRSWMQQEAATLSQVSGYGGLTRVPSAEGEHPEWQFARMGAYAFLIETNTEFQPSYDSAVAEANLVWPGILSVLERPISISGHVTDATTGAPLAARIDLLNVTFPNGETNNSGGSYGAYHIFVPAGTYNVRFSAPGYASSTSSVSVTETSATVVDIELSPAAPEQLVFSDDFETNQGWTVNPAATDTATAGRWERGDPQATSSSGPKQLGTTTSGINDLVTGRLAGSSSGANDLDGGLTSVRSPEITLPASGNITLSFRYYLAHGSNASSADFLRFRVVGTTTTTVFQEIGDGADDDGVWATATIDLSAFAGQTIRILIEAADAGSPSLIEAGVDDVRIVQQ